ncbi:hypothetical protein XELAEV_18021006mg [Xenopus laevis]|uniref:Uncharacterized protein n=1 Tax=Xenopus laevis TaxID=8355 RepID=A0A974D810_XENLA|nr:hypothetical protein XELAEV_18021006mg [Xenopus laevis]
MNLSGSACQENSSVSLDLLNLYFVNQISRNMKATKSDQVPDQLFRIHSDTEKIKSDWWATLTKIRSLRRQVLASCTPCLIEMTCKQVSSHEIKLFVGKQQQNNWNKTERTEMIIEMNTVSFFQLLDSEQNEDMPGESYKSNSGVCQWDSQDYKDSFCYVLWKQEKCFFQSKKEQILSSSSSFIYILDVCGKHHAWSQTDSSLHTAEKHDVSVQCDILQEYKCTECSSGNHSLGKNSKQVINLSPTRGQHTPLNPLNKLFHID